MSEPIPLPLSDYDSYYPDLDEVENDPSWDSEVVYVKCGRCRGTGIDPDCARSHQDDEWDCLECEGYGDIPIQSERRRAIS